MGLINFFSVRVGTELENPLQYIQYQSEHTDHLSTEIVQQKVNDKRQVGAGADHCLCGNVC